tara:strand:+ start:8119 stop:9684 length:1566 start_codon:yes stop_codon:yes gene_type:complete
MLVSKIKKYKMKKIIIISIFLSFVFITTSCNKEELDLSNPNALTTGQFWKTPQDAELGVNSIYAMFYKDGLWTRWMHFRLELTSDIGQSDSPWLELADWTRFNYVNYNFWEGNVNTWRDTYKAVFRANQVLEYVPNIEFNDDNRKKQILAEAKFLRALHYYYAAILWENVPLVLKPSNTSDLPEQNTLEEVFSQIEKDLNEAFVDLPSSWPSDQVGRPTKGAAQGFLAKAYMQQRKWVDAKNALDYLMTGEGAIYDLVPEFKDNFTHYNENNTESIFEIQYAREDSRLGGSGESADAAVSLQRSQFFAPRGIGWSDGEACYWLVDEFKKEKDLSNNYDIRLRHSLFYQDLTTDFGDLVYNRNWQWGSNEAWFRKYQRDYYRDNEDYFCEINFRMIRFSDVLLRYAEVLNELDQTSEAYQYVDRVRARVNLGPLATAYPAIGNNKTLFLERLKMERVLELSGECVRWEDLKRWGDLDNQASVDEIALRDPAFSNFVVGKSSRLPIPQVDVDNNPNLNQNPKY